MKQILLIAGLVLFYSTMYGQGNPSNLPQDKSSQTQNVSLVPSISQNYIVTYTYRAPLLSHPSSMTTGQMSPEIQYFDGLGRPSESVKVNYSQLGFDVIDKKEYDNYGNLIKEFLPYTKTGANSGNFITNFSSEQSTFIGGLYTSEGSYGYSITEYEKSPLNRVVKQGAPGASWQLNKPVTTTYRTNTTADNVKTYNYTGDTPSPEYTFPAGKLYVTETTDEDGKTVREFKDMDGKVIQKEMNGAKTRYCYDEFGRLKCVVQPEGPSPTSTDNCFYYKYDNKNRMTDKRLPVKDWEYYIYDSRDRLVLTQDGNQRVKSTPEWSYTMYDNLNRPVEQGTWTTSALRATLITSINNSLTYMSDQATRTPLKYLYYDIRTKKDFYALDATALSADTATCNIGRQTGEKTKLLDSETGMTLWLFTAIYYDKYGRVLQTGSDNHLGGKDYITNKYNFSGEVIQTRNRHIGSYTDTYFDLDHRGRLMKIRHKIDGANEKILSANSYDEAGSLIDKYLHSESGGAFLQRNDYKYNIRGWLTEINNPSTFTENDKFGLRLYYNGGPYPSSTLYNGNVAGMLWGTPNHYSMYYVFTYDGSNRVTNANFYKSGIAANGLDANYTYDKNGNLKTLIRYDLYGNYIDRLTYTYSGNRIIGLSDASGDVPLVVDYPGSTGTMALSYDQNGNVNVETHKLISINYNLLNLPKELNWLGQNKYVKYFYTFNGEKLRKTVENNGTITKVDYCGPFVYETVSGTRSLKYIITPEGRAVKNGTTWDYEYNLTDHLGNVRAVIHKGANGLAELIQQKHYYPFGMEMSQLNLGTGTNKYLYNGKEHQNDFNLDWYDYGARFYDPMIGRWHSVDPMAESYYSQSPYHFSGNNPILFVDANGMDYWSTNDANEIARFLRSMQSGSGGFSSFDYQGWNHATDAEFTGNLTYNDQSNMFYSSYGTIRNEEATRVGISISGLVNSDNGRAGILSEAGANWLRKSTGAIESSYPIENLLIGGAVAKPLTFLAGRLLSGIAGRFAAKGVQTTLHGAERVAGAAATRGGVLSVEGINATKTLGKAFTQGDGATVFLHEVTPGRFNAVVQGNKGIITTMENWSQKSINRIAKNYGWKLE